MSTDEPRPLRVVSENSERTIAHNHATEEACQAAAVAAANLLRVMRGAGKPESIVHDAKAVVERFTNAAELSMNRAYPAYDAGQFLRSLVASEQRGSSAEARAVDAIVRGALQIAASRMLGQNTQENAGYRELKAGIARLRNI